MVVVLSSFGTACDGEDGCHCLKAAAPPMLLTPESVVVVVGLEGGGGIPPPPSLTATGTGPMCV